MPSFESDICIVGGGISAVFAAQKLSELKSNLSITIVEAGRRLFDAENRMSYRRRSSLYGENAWPGDFIEDQGGLGVISRTMAVGGSAMHWQGHANRFSEEDLRLHSLYGLATDWPIEWAELEKYCCEAERRIGVSGEPSPHPEDKRSEPYPMPLMPLTYNLAEIKAWAERSGIPFTGCPQAKNSRAYDGRPECQRCNTCTICPTGARYSPDYTYKQLLATKKITLHDRTLIRRLIPHDRNNTIVAATGFHAERPGEPVEYRARLFVVASGYAWTPHLLLSSQTSRFPNGLANSSGLVGRYMTGHYFITAQMEVDKKLYPGMNEPYPLISREYFRCAPGKPFVRHDIQIFESASGRRPRLKSEKGEYLFGDALVNDWRSRTAHGVARVRMYYDTHPSRESSLTLDPDNRNHLGDPMPKIVHRMDPAAEARDAATEAHVRAIYEKMAKANGTKILSVSKSDYQDHPSGGCRMGNDPSQSVCDSYGRTHDHQNLFAVGAPTLPTGGCTNATITFVALTLRSSSHIAQTL
ncbi:MAG: GMC family oxidoreductase [Bryobacteraceae bacterium]|jgi:choline dehydrogenase-like flavoprotein